MSGMAKGLEKMIGDKLDRMDEMEKSKTFKNGVQGHMDSEPFDNTISGGTLDNQKYPNNINRRSYSLDTGKELCEDPPEFVNSAHKDDYKDLINRSIDQGISSGKGKTSLGELKSAKKVRNGFKLNLASMKKDQDEFIRQNSQTPFGSYKVKGHLSQRGSISKGEMDAVRQGPLTSRSYIEEDESKKKMPRHYKHSRGSRMKVRRSKQPREGSPRSQQDFLNEDSQTIG
mmetsp:Transcript_38735/g.58909  ORF Transcript_38735/g.58909 Transcript_38735/m.58909 type:complete len:229 (-) Transcript_38735:965-1651(-)